MKSLRSIIAIGELENWRIGESQLPPSVMAGEAVVQRVFLPVTVHAKTHVVIDGALGDSLIVQVAVARGTIDARAYVGRVVEADVGGVREAVDTLPRNLDALVRIRRDLLDQRTIGRDLTVADHAGLHARDAGDRTFLHAFVAVRTHRFFCEMDFVRERDRLLRVWTAAEEVGERGTDRAVRRRVDRRRHLGLRRSAARDGA